jgi:hypothetical protein
VVAIDNDDAVATTDQSHAEHEPGWARTDHGHLHPLTMGWTDDRRTPGLARRGESKLKIRVRPLVSSDRSLRSLLDTGGC